MTARTHGQKGTRLYNIWRNMKARCNKSQNKDYKHYGGRGIAVCSEWQNDFASFYSWAQSSGYSDTLTIDRIDSNGDYCPDNCRWITLQDQQRNKRSNRCITYNNETHSISEWARIIGVSRKTLDYRLEKWGVEKALCTPANNNKRNGKMLTHNGETHNVKEWAQKLGMAEKTLQHRVEKWGVERAFNTPLNITYSNNRKNREE